MRFKQFLLVHKHIATDLRILAEITQRFQYKFKLVASTRELALLLYITLYYYQQNASQIVHLLNELTVRS